jgi:DNA-directed RNA polymerase subunit beta
MKATLDKDAYETQHDALIELSRKTRPSEIPSAEATKQFIFSQFFSTQFYNLGEVGRFKVDKKLALANRLVGLTAAEDIKEKKNVIVSAGEVITAEQAKKIQNAGINGVWVIVDGKRHKMYGNNRVKLDEVIKCNEKELGIKHQVYYPMLDQILKEYKTKEERIEAIRANAKFCPVCGAVQGAKCAKCGAAVSKSAKFCPECGTAVSTKKVCKSCGEEVKPTAKFCPNCGKKC